MTRLPTNPTADAAHRAVPRAAHPVEQLLDVLGAESPLAEDVIGDLAEEYAARQARDGTAAARWWYARQATCAVPHLLWSALRHGRPAARRRLLVFMAGTALATLTVVVAVRAIDGAPARLVAGHEGTPDRVVVSTVRRVKIPMRVLDARGHVLPDSAVRFAWEAGGAAHVWPEGVAQCVKPGITIARAQLGDLVTRVRLDCQPVAKIRLKHWYNMVLGDSAQELHVGGIGLDGQPVTRLAAALSIDDTAVATLVGKRVLPVAPGRAYVTVSVGETWALAAVTVFEPVRTLAGLRPDQRFVIAPIRLRPGEAQRWPLPEGSFWMVNQVDHDGDAPALETAGPVSCTPALSPGVYRTQCWVRAPGATLTLAHPPGAAKGITGALTIER